MNLTLPKKNTVNVTETEMTLGALLRRPYQFLSTQVYARLADMEYPDVRPAHSAVFRHIAPDGCRVTELAERAQMTKQSMGSLVEYLLQRGYVQTAPDATDGRAKIVCLTERGRALQQRAIEISRAVEQEMGRRIGEPEMRQLRLLLEQLYAVLELESRAIGELPPLLEDRKVSGREQQQRSTSVEAQI